MDKKYKYTVFIIKKAPIRLDNLRIIDNSLSIVSNLATALQHEVEFVQALANK
jgi:hypothetical protein